MRDRKRSVILALGVGVLAIAYSQLVAVQPGNDVAQIAVASRTTPTPFGVCTTPTPLYGNAQGWYYATQCGSLISAVWDMSKAPSPIPQVGATPYCALDLRDLDVSTTYARSWDCHNQDGSDIGATYFYIQGNPRMAPLQATPTGVVTMTPTP